MATSKMKDRKIRKEFILRNLDFFKSTTFVNEMGVNSKNIVDLAALDFKNNIFYGFEIKSEADNLQRLYKQLSSYTTFFNIVYVVAHYKHTQAVLNLIQNNVFAQNVGYIEVSDNMDFTELKKAKYVKPRFDTFLRNLDMEELTSLCESKGQYLGWEGKNLLVDKVKRSTSLDEIYEHLHKKVNRYFSKECPKCHSKLYYNKRNRDGRLVSYCYECESEIE